MTGHGLTFVFYLSTLLVLFFLFIEYSLFKGVWEGNKEGQMNEEEAILIFYLGVSIQFIFDSCRI